ncbi:TsoY family (seleno)protein [Polycladidibacter stylochi]|uniref:TsoY family (seleno)protein n=1 Tax=Polycladidibacter stylochi TaxID=1807766 RepID=UPI00082D0D7F|nr:hypothetical protein [Pseudovibrio stylochi]
MSTFKNLGERYSPLYFLSSVGAGGLAISFFMYLMWMTPHKGSPIPSYSTLMPLLKNGSTIQQAMIATALLAIIYFIFMHLRLLVWNLKQYSTFKASSGFSSFKNSNAESQLMAIPLTYAMTMNAGFIGGALFVPGLWESRELLFPFSLVAFSAIGIYAMRIYLDFISRSLTTGGYDCAKNNSLGQMIAVFSFAMVGVGFSAVAAMSHVKLVSALGFMGSVFFISAAILLGFIKLILGFRSMMEHKAAGETTPTLWILIPFITVVGIALYRLKMAMAHNFDGVVTASGNFAFFSVLFSIQLLFGLIGWSVMKKVGYYDRWISGPEKSPSSYALVCPGVALFVFGNFLINAGLVKIGVVAYLSTAYFALYAPIIAVQLVTVWLFFKLNSKLLKEEAGAQLQAAE